MDLVGTDTFKNNRRVIGIDHVLHGNLTCRSDCFARKPLGVSFKYSAVPRTRARYPFETDTDDIYDESQRRVLTGGWRDIPS